MGEKTQVLHAATVREDDMMVVVLKAISGRKPPEGMSTEQALAGWPDDVLDMAHRIVRDLMDHLSERLTEAGAPPDTVTRIKEGRLQ